MVFAEPDWPGRPLAAEIQCFLAAAVITGDPALPVRYPKPDEIAGLQVGFRFHGHTGELLTSTAAGAWQPGWLVVALNGLDDPFLVDLGHTASGYPVYYAPHGAGRWNAVLVAPSLRRVTELLSTLRDLEGDDARAMQVITEQTDITNALWREVLQARQERGLIDEEPSAHHDLTDLEPVQLVITDFGPHKLKVVQIVRRVLHLTLPQTVALTAERDVVVGSGPKVRLHHLQVALAAAGATTAFRPIAGPAA